jgi:NAD(P)H dehydrogenase (quinone)
MSKILVVYQSFGGKTKSLAEAVADGARSVGAQVELKEAASAEASDMAGTDGLIVATTQPFDSMAGEIKKFLEKLWIGRESVGNGISFAGIVCYKTDPAETEKDVDVIVGYLGMKMVGGWLAVKEDKIETGKEPARRLGIAVAQGG